MNIARHARRTACVVAAFAACMAAQAQSRLPGVTATSPPRTANPGQFATLGLPSAGGVRAPFPAGLTAGSGPGAAVDPNATPASTSNLTTTVDPAAAAARQAANAMPTGSLGNGGVTTVVVDAGTAASLGAPAPATAVMGAGPAVMVVRSLGGPYTPLEVAASFLNADINSDGELTRAEATRLAILPMPFEEIDANHDGRVSRGEYENTLRGAGP